MNLIIDIGNTFAKLAVFDGDIILFKKGFKSNKLKHHYHSAITKYPFIDKAIVSSVGHLKASELAYISMDVALLILDSDTELPFKNLYKTPKTLGVDRMALVSGSVKLYPNKDVLIIDAGTCITYDFITCKNEYLGGAISPGIRLRYQSLHNLTANLPLLDTDLPLNIVGNSTETAIHSGVIMGIINEIDGVISNYKEIYPNLTVILTGGDTDFLSNQLKNSIFANSDFLLEGLNYILEFNSL